MSLEKQKVAIAEFCGLKCVRTVGDHLEHGEYPDAMRVPDYFNDLNAIREVEQKLLTIENPGKYLDQLVLVVAKSQRFSGDCPRKALKYVGVSPVVCADARQRAEALLKTIGKWED